MRGAADLAGARNLPALAGGRTPALSLAWLGIRHPQRPVLVRPEAGQGEVLSGRGRARRGTGQGTGEGPRERSLRGRDLPGAGRGQLCHRRDINRPIRLVQNACYKPAPETKTAGSGQMSKQSMREEAERLIRETMEKRSIVVKQGHTTIDARCGKCGAPNS